MIHSSGPCTPDRPLSAMIVRVQAISQTQTPPRSASSGAQSQDELTLSIEASIAQELEGKFEENQDDLLLGQISKWSGVLRRCKEMGFFSDSEQGWVIGRRRFGADVT